MLLSSGERIPPCGGASVRVPLRAILAEDACLEERLNQSQNALVSDPTPHPVAQGRVRNLVEARLDVAFYNPFVRAGAEVMDLGDRVMSPASRTEAIADTDPAASPGRGFHARKVPGRAFRSPAPRGPREACFAGWEGRGSTRRSRGRGFVLRIAGRAQRGCKRRAGAPQSRGPARARRCHTVPAPGG